MCVPCFYVWHGASSSGVCHTCVCRVCKRDMMRSQMQEAWSGCLQEEKRAYLYWLNLPFSQLGEVDFLIICLVPVKTVWLSRAIVYVIFPVNRLIWHSAVWVHKTTANVLNSESRHLDNSRCGFGISMSLDANPTAWYEIIRMTGNTVNKFDLP